MARSIDVIIGLVALALLLAVIAFVLLYSFPQAASRFGFELQTSNPDAANAAGRVSALTDSILHRASQGYSYRIAPVVDRLTGAHVTTESAPAMHVVGFPADSCTECHPSWQDRPLFSVVYMPHGEHAAEQITCEACHAESGPGRDSVPLMSGCAECHDEALDGSKMCDTCHPPGSLFHGAKLSSSRSIGEQCETCHSPRSLAGTARSHDMPVFDNRASACTTCHTTESCGSCHPAAHPGSYENAHFKDLRSGSRLQIQCYSCHDSARCSRCHVSAARR